VQAEDKYTTKAKLRIRIQTSDPFLFRYRPKLSDLGTPCLMEDSWP